MTGFKTKPKQFTSWSNSRWGDYELCPAKANYKHNLKLPEPKHPAMQRGIEIAQKEEDYFKGKIKLVPEEIAESMKPLFRDAKKEKGLFVEALWGFSNQWKPVDWFDWENCWLRVKVDVGWSKKEGKDLIVYLVDNKTGKYSQYGVEEYLRQLRLYAAAAAVMYPDAKEFRCRLWFTDLGYQHPQENWMIISMAEAVKLQKEFTKMVQPMLNDKRFDPTPNFKCKWCHYRKDNGGPCKFSGAG